MTIGRICSRQVDLAELDESARVAAQRMLQRQVGSLIVVDALRVPVGILTDRDLVMKVMARGISPEEATVADAMTEHPHYVHEDATIEDGLRMMRAGRHRRLPVVDGDGRLIGIISIDDVLMLISEEMQAIGKLIERESPSAVG
ncbi:MAG: CBS domain-containing protein [Planctomycetota bacterium]|jgi:CBS domain-containing protein